MEEFLSILLWVTINLFKVKKEECILKFPENWLTAHRLRMADLEQEKTYLEDKEFILEFY